MATPDRPPVKDRPDRLDLPGPVQEGAPPAPPARPRGPGLIDCLGWGMGAAWSCRRLLLFVLLANLVVAAAVAYPLLAPMDESLSHHPDAAEVGARMDQRWWSDLTRQSAPIFGRTIDTLGLASLAMVLMGTFFAGGLLAALRHGRMQPLSFEPLPDPAYGDRIPQWRAASHGPATVRVFLKESAGHFPRLFVLLLISLALYALVETIFNRLAAGAASSLLELVEDERAALLIGAFKSGLFVLAFHAVTVIFEYARAHEILRPGTTLFPLLALPFRLLLRRPGVFIGIEVAAVLIQAAVVAAFTPIDALLATSPALAVTAGFAATQIFMFTRLLVRATANAAQIRLALAEVGEPGR